MTADPLAVVNSSWHVAGPRGVGSLTAEPLLLLPLQRLAGEVQACWGSRFGVISPLVALVSKFIIYIYIYIYTYIYICIYIYAPKPSANHQGRIMRVLPDRIYTGFPWSE